MGGRRNQKLASAVWGGADGRGSNMPTYTGKDGKVRLARAPDTGDGPAGKDELGQVIRWRLDVSQELADGTTFSDEYRALEAGLKTWDAEIELLWDAESASVRQSELWECLLADSFPGSLAEDGRIELTLFVEGEEPGGKRAYVGTGVVRSARVLTSREGIVRWWARLAGTGPLLYRSGFFDAGTFGAWEGYTFDGLEAHTFQSLETLPEVT